MRQRAPGQAGDDGQINIWERGYTSDGHEQVHEPRVGGWWGSVYSIFQIEQLPGSYTSSRGSKLLLFTKMMRLPTQSKVPLRCKSYGSERLYDLSRNRRWEVFTVLPREMRNEKHRVDYTVRKNAGDRAGLGHKEVGNYNHDTSKTGGGSGRKSRYNST